MLFRQSERVWIAQAPAKVNLGLRILGRRPDGYHQLDTVMARVSLCDTLVVETVSSTELRLRVRLAYPPALAGEPIPETSDNLVLRAAELLRQRSGAALGARITLVKRIPAAAGLGGGSSDAATALVVLNRAWNLRLSTEELSSHATELGSDVPFFLTSAVYARCTGRGERVQPLPVCVRLPLVLARPHAGLSTAAVYRRCQPAPSDRSIDRLIAALREGDVREAARHLQNGLQEPAEELSEDILRLKAEFARLPVGGHQMTGSGSAYFGVCRSPRQAKECAARLKARGIPAVWNVSTCA